MSVKSEPPIGLFEKIIERIEKAERRRKIQKLVIFSITLIGSGLSFIPAYNMLQTDFEQSGFVYFFSLLFSDFQVVAASWQTFSVVLLEKLPALSLAVFFGLLIVFLESMKYIAKNIRIWTSLSQNFFRA